MNERIAVIGTGRIGAPFAALAAARGFEVAAVECDAARRAALAARRPPVFEPGLAEILAQAGDRLEVGAELGPALAGAGLIFLVVPTPSRDDGSFSLEFVLPVAEALGHALRERNDRPVVVVTSTVSPGQTDGPIREAIERAGGLRCGRDFGLCYSPEFVALGEVVDALREPAWVLIGESDAESGACVEAFFRRLCTNDPPLARLTPLDAELAKLAVNGFLTTRISYANMLAMVCEGLPGADVDAVTRAMGMDPRIGPRALTGAVAYGGPCLPRDNAALSALAERLGVGADLPAATDRTNEAATERLHERVRALVGPGARVAILGLAYKPDSDVCISAGLDLARRLGREGTPVSVFDPMAMESARRALAGTPHVDFGDDLATALRRADVAVVATPWECFARLDAGLLERPAGSRLVLVDCWRILDREDVRKRVDYVPLGRGPQGEGSPSERTLDAA